MKIRSSELKINSNDIKNENDIEKLKRYKLELDFHSGEIKNQLFQYKVKFKEDGISGDYQWFIRAKTKSRLYGILSQEIQNRIASLNNINKTTERICFVDAFMDNCRKMIDNDLFIKILYKTKQDVK